ncbi:effector-associated constant component EACC1 [Streptomyces sp. NPDC054961]
MDVEGLLAAFGAASAASALVRALTIWVRSRHPGRARLKIGGDEVSLDLSNPSEAVRYLKAQTNSDPSGR